MHTTDYILDETFTLVFRRIPINIAINAISIIDESIEKGYLVLDRITPERFNKAKELRLKYQDKPMISFTDLTSMVVMLEKGIDKILSEDDHFSYVEIGFQKIP